MPALLICLVVAACTQGPTGSERLLGRWKSDRETTLARLEPVIQLTEFQRDWFDENLGVLEIEYTEDSVISQIDEWRTEGSYRVVGEGVNFVDLEIEGESVAVRRIWVEGDQMWTRVDPLGFAEYFQRIR